MDSRDGSRGDARVTLAIREPASSYDWSRTRARRRGGAAVQQLNDGDWPSASVVTARYGTWAAARTAAAVESGMKAGEPQ
jgi:hypothetical protein